MLKELWTLIKMLFATRPSDYLGKDLKYYLPCGVNKYNIKGAKKIYKQLGGTPEAWKAYIKTL